MEATKRIAEFICDTSAQDFSPETVTYAKSLALSCLGQMVAGSTRPAGRILLEYVRQIGAKPQAGVAGGGLRTSMDNAALANGTFTHATELEDDSFPEGCYTANVLPAVFALGESLELPGKSILEGFVLGYEIEGKMGLYCPGLAARNIFPSHMLGSLAVAAGAAKMLSLDVEQTRNALSLAASQASGIGRQTGRMAHLFEAGVGARNGLVAALLARGGLTGDPNILEGPKGFCDVYAGEGGYDLEALVRNLGEPFRVMEVGVKKYPCCYLLQRIIDGVLNLKREHRFSPDAVEGVTVEVNSVFPDLIQYPEPSNGEEARFSVTHSIAAALLQEKPFLDTYTDETVLAPKFKEMRARVKMVVHPEWEPGFVTGVVPVTVELRDGAHYSIDCVKARGDPPDLLTPEEVMGKFRACAELVLLPGQVERAAQLTLELDKLPNVTELMRILTFPEVSRAHS